MSYLHTVRKTKEELKQKQAAPDATEGDVIAVLIDSPIVGLVWFAFNDGFKSGDDIPMFFASELRLLQKMSETELRKRYEQKQVVGGGWID
jgi:hypothetical protein